MTSKGWMTVVAFAAIVACESNSTGGGAIPDSGGPGVDGGTALNDGGTGSDGGAPSDGGPAGVPELEAYLHVDDRQGQGVEEVIATAAFRGIGTTAGAFDAFNSSEVTALQGLAVGGCGEVTTAGPFTGQHVDAAPVSLGTGATKLAEMPFDGQGNYYVAWLEDDASTPLRGVPLDLRTPRGSATAFATLHPLTVADTTCGSTTCVVPVTYAAPIQDLFVKVPGNRICRGDAASKTLTFPTTELGGTDRLVVVTIVRRIDTTLGASTAKISITSSNFTNLALP